MKHAPNAEKPGPAPIKRQGRAASRLRESDSYKGERLLWACTDPGDDFNPSRWDSFNCPLCHATGEADRELAEEWARDSVDADAE